MIARPYQSALSFDIIKLLAAGHKRIMLQLATGGGKTAVAADLVRRYGSKRVLYTVPSDEILDQTSTALARAGVDHVVLRGGSRIRSLDGVGCILAMSQTLTRRVDGDLFANWEPDLIVLDEAHKLIEQHRKVLNLWQCPVVGQTATPVRLDGKMLADLCPVLVTGPQIKQLTRQGFLVPCRTIDAPMPDLGNVRIAANGEYDDGDLDKAYSDRKLVATVPDWWLKYARGKKTIAFTAGVTSSRRLVAAYQARGIRAEHVDGDTPMALRKEALSRLSSGAVEILCNCALFIEGLDLPEVECVQLVSATQSLASFLQRAGRGLRISPRTGKRELILLDHGGSSIRHDRVDADRDWYHGGMSLEHPKKTCLCCGALIDAAHSVCPSCYRDPSPARAAPDAMSAMAIQRQQRAQSRAVKPRGVPGWLLGRGPALARAWAAAEAQRWQDGLPLDYPDDVCRGLLARSA